MSSSLYQHGARWSEVDTATLPALPADSGIPIAIGCAPLWMVPGGTKNVNVPFMFFSLAQAQAAMGISTDYATYDLSEAINTAFNKYRFAPIGVIAVNDPLKNATSAAPGTVAVANGQAVLTSTGIIYDTVVITSVGGTVVTYKINVDYTLAYDANGHMVVTVVPGGAAAAATNVGSQFSTIATVSATSTDYLGGVNSSGQKTGAALLDEIYPRFDIVPGFLIAPKFETDHVLLGGLCAIAESIDGFAAMVVGAIDMSSSGAPSIDDVELYKSTNSLTSHRLILTYLKPTWGGITQRFSIEYAVAAGVLDTANGGNPYESVSNKPFQCDGTLDGNGNPVFLSRTDANFLNSLGVVTARRTKRGWVIWGNNTAAYPGTTDPKDRFIPNRRYMDFVGNTTIVTYDIKVDKPGNRRQIDSVTNGLNGWLADQKNGGYALSYYVRFDQLENSDENLMVGHYIVRIGETSPTPMEDLEFILEFTADFSSLFSSSTGNS